MKNRFRDRMLSIFSGCRVDRHFLSRRSQAENEASGFLSTIEQRASSALSGESFIRQAMDRLAKVPSFGALAIKLDKANPRNSSSRTDTLSGPMKALFHEIDSLCRQKNGLWGRLDSKSVGCFFEGANGRGCQEISKCIQEQMLRQKKKSVSIGMAVFPMIDYVKSDIMDNAVKALAHAGFLGPGSKVMFDAVSLNISGDAYYQKGNISAAVKEFQNALKIDAENVNVHNSLGVCYGVQGSFEKALDCFETAIALDAGHVMAYYNAGYVCQRMGRNETAMQYLLKADESGEEVFEVAFQIGKLCLIMGDPAKGKMFFQKALAANPDAVAIHCHLGDCAEALGERDAAIVHYEAAVKKNPNDASALSALGWLYDQKGENPEISTLFCEKSVEISPKNGLFQYRLGTVYANNSMPDRARTAFGNAVKLGYDATSEIKQIELQVGCGNRERLSN